MNRCIRSRATRFESDQPKRDRSWTAPDRQHRPLKYLQLRSRFGWSLSNLVALLRMHLFTHRDLWAWLDQPVDGPPAILTTTQGELAFGSSGQQESAP